MLQRSDGGHRAIHYREGCLRARKTGERDSRSNSTEPTAHTAQVPLQTVAINLINLTIRKRPYLFNSVLMRDSGCSEHRISCCEITPHRGSQTHVQPKVRWARAQRVALHGGAEGDQVLC